MDFELTESQQAVAELAAQVLAAADPWKELAQAGLLDVSELGVPGIAVLLTELGRRAAPDSLKALATLMTGALPIARWGDATLRQELLPPIASGELTLTAALREPSNPAPAIPATTVERDGDVGGGKITGTKIGVPHADHSHRLLVPARLTPAPSMIVRSSGQIVAQTAHDHGVAPTGVVLVAPGAPGVRLTQTPSSSGQPEFTLHMDQAPVESVLGPAECVQDLYYLAVAGACALIDGAVAGALALTRDHVATREQFGRPLAAFQAVSQQIADVYIASRTLHLATLSACWQLNEGRDQGADLDVAGYWCAEQAPRAVRTCHHLHGGLGMDVTYPLHRFSSLVADLVRFLGGAEYRLERLACSPN
jgi:3-oxo-4-pregnene-20-carboxyl-CoA dehydrogenase alpha subunit